MSNSRYIRQTLLDKIGDTGQQKLRDAHVIVIGCGGLGSIAAPYLAGAGVGKLTLVDGDKPDVTNLHRQVFFGTQYDAGLSKAEALAQHIRQLNDEVHVTAINKMVAKGNAAEIIIPGSIVLECTDNIQAKYLVNDYCHLEKIPVAYGAIHKYDGYVSFFENESEESIHLRDIFAEPNEDIPSCSEVGVIGTIAGLIGLLQANEVIKHITDAGPTLSGSLLSYNILNNEQLKLKLKKTYKEDVKAVYNSSSYFSLKACQVAEITYDEVMQMKEKYRLVSVLPDEEHVPLDDENNRCPMDQLIATDWTAADHRTTVFYCMSGKRSAYVAASILAEQSGAEVLSMKEGISGTID